MSQNVNSNLAQAEPYGINTIKGTTAERDAIVLLYEGLIFYNTDTSSYNIYNGTNWVALLSEWMPPQIPLGSILTAGATFFINGGAGVYCSFTGGQDDIIFANVDLNNGATNMYDGSDLAIKLHGRLSSNGGVGDTVGLVLNYALIKVGDNSSTTVTSVAQQNVDVSSELQDIDFVIELATMTGVVDAHYLMFDITRNGAGVGADTYAGNYELTALEIIKK